MSFVIPLYPLYALLFADTGLSDADISVLFVIWSGVGIVAEVPMGAVADRFSRRHAMVAAGVGQAAGYVLWTAWPGYAGFALGFVAWSLFGALSSGTLEALVYDGLAAVGAQSHYVTVLGRIRAAELLSQLPNAAAATLLFAVGGYPLVGWVSVGMCLCAAALATRLPEAPRSAPDSDDDADDLGYFATLRAGVAEAAARPAVRGAVAAVALLAGLDAFEEYFSLLANEWGVPVIEVPFAVLVIPVAGAIGAAVGGRYGRLRPALLCSILAAGVVVLGAAGVLHRPIGLVGLGLFYGLYRLVWLVADARLQESITGRARATVTSVAELGTEFTCLLVYAAWAVHQVIGIAVLGLAVALLLPFCLRRRTVSASRG
ncbi:MAG TPA: MFS transporter [Pseudonocardiaceae bacterium]|nr:MFS transporter [Pseudonocardiaceae bacterium]